MYLNTQGLPGVSTTGSLGVCLFMLSLWIHMESQEDWTLASLKLGVHLCSRDVMHHLLSSNERPHALTSVFGFPTLSHGSVPSFTHWYLASLII